MIDLNLLRLVVCLKINDILLKHSILCYYLNMSIKDLFIRPSFNYIANQGWMSFVLLLAGIIAGVISPWNTSFYIKMFSFIFWYICFLPYLIIYTFIIQTILLALKKDGFLLNKYFFLFNLVLIGIPFYYLRIDDIYATPGSLYSFVLILTFFLLAIVFGLLTLLPFIVQKYREKRKNIIIENSIFTQNKFILWGSLIGTVLYILISSICLFCVLCF